MDIRIIKNLEDVAYHLISENVILLTSKGNRKLGRLVSQRLELFYIDENRKEAVLPQVDKYAVWDIRNVWGGSNYIYFTQCERLNEYKIMIRLYRFQCNTKEIQVLYQLVEESAILLEQKKTRIFILDENYLLIQHMYLKRNMSEKYQGFYDYELYLYDYNERKSYLVTDPYLSQAGIEVMLPISKNICSIKVGYNLLHENRFEHLEQSETVIEGIGFINVKQFISDILVNQKNIYIDYIDQVQFDKTIPSMKYYSDYLIYSKVNRDNRQEEIIFFHYPTKESKVCVNPNIRSAADLARPYLFNGLPYVLLERAKGIEFFNVTQGTVDYFFEKKYHIQEIMNNNIITTIRMRKGIFRRKMDYIEVYQFKKKEPILNEKAVFGGAVSPDTDKIYLFTR